jgi:hypothetical protein
MRWINTNPPKRKHDLALYFRDPFVHPNRDNYSVKAIANILTPDLLFSCLQNDGYPKRFPCHQLCILLRLIERILIPSPSSIAEKSMISLPNHRKMQMLYTTAHPPQVPHEFSVG